jgi:hypothetical protein
MIVRPTGNPVTDTLKNMNSDLREARSKLAVSELLLDEEKKSKSVKRSRGVTGVLFLFPNFLEFFKRMIGQGEKRCRRKLKISRHKLLP